MKRRIAWLAALILLATTAPAQEWQQFRGPESNTAVASGGYPRSLTLDSDLAWRINLPGPGSSSPIVLGDSIYVTCEIDDQDGLVCYGLDGQERWRRAFGPRRQGKHRTATGANPTPTTDGERLFAYYKSGRLVALDLTGKELWRHNLQEEIGPDTLWWDLGTSPVLTEAGVLIAVMQEGDSYLITYDSATGEVVWKTPRQFECARESDQAYTTPIFLRHGDQTTLVTFGADHLTGHDPMTGKELFALDGFNPQNEGMWRVIASPTLVDGVAVVPFGRGDFLAGVAFDHQDGTTKPRHAWTLEGVGADVPSPVGRDGLVYQLDEKGRMTCVVAATGEQRWSGRLPRSRATYFATPLLAGELLYCVREDGGGHVVRAAEGLEVVGTIDLEDESVVTPVPLSDSRLLVRTRNRLYLFNAE